MSHKPQNIEFVIKPKEDLYLVGRERTLLRVRKDDPYPCQMQRTQSFSCLFRHYAKHNGLCKDDLVFYFTEELQPDENPELVHLQPYDEIWVEHRKSANQRRRLRGGASDAVFFDQFRDLLARGEHTDVEFIVGKERESVEAHKAILVARSDYFHALFRKGGMRESVQGVVEVPQYSPQTFRRMLEHLYTNRVKGLDSCTTNEVLELLTLANEYLLTDLKCLCECAASAQLNQENIGRMMLVADDFKADLLKEACKDYVSDNFSEIRDSEAFRQEVKCTPELALHLLDSLPERRNKRRRVEVEMDGAVSSNENVQQLPPTSTAAVAPTAAVGPSFTLSLPSTVLQDAQGLPF